MRKIPFSPPDITEEEIQEVCQALRSGWITTGPKTKEFERQIAAFCGTDRAVCLNSATACLEMTLRILGIGPGDEVITSAYTYTASASPVCHVGAKLVLVDTLPGSYEMDPEKLAAAITERTKAVIPVDLGGILADYDTIYAVVEDKKALFTPESELQKKIGRVAVVADGAHSFGAVRHGKRSGCFADFTTFSFHAVKNLTTAEGGAATWNPVLGLDAEVFSASIKQIFLPLSPQALLECLADIPHVLLRQCGVQGQGDFVFKLGKGIGIVPHIKAQILIGRQQGQGLIMHIGGHALLCHFLDDLAPLGHGLARKPGQIQMAAGNLVLPEMGCMLHAAIGQQLIIQPHQTVPFFQQTRIAPQLGKTDARHDVRHIALI